MGWLTKFRDECLKVPGQHIDVTATTGMGKTNVLTFVLDGLIRYGGGRNTIVWFDLGKSSEILTISKFKPLHLIIPKTMDVQINLWDEKDTLDVKKTYYDRPEQVWDKLIKSRINVICLQPFVRNPDQFTPPITAMFSTLIDRAHNYDVPIPMDIFFDEFNILAPGKGHAYSPEHAKFGAVMQYNIERLRSLKIRFIASAQGWTHVRKGCRVHFHWIVAKNGCRFNEGRLSKYNAIFDKLKCDQGIICYPENYFSDVVNFKYYGNPEDIGQVRYIGSIRSRDDPRYDPDYLSLEELMGIPAQEPQGDDIDINGSELLALLDEPTREAYYAEAIKTGQYEKTTQKDEVIISYLKSLSGSEAHS